MKNKKEYNCGLNLITIVLAVSFYILSALIDLIIDLVTSTKTNASDNGTSVKTPVKEEK